MTAEEIKMIVEEVLKKMGVGIPHPDAPLPAQELYSIINCAHITGLSTWHIRRAVVGGTLTSSDVGTKDRPVYRIHRDNLKKWLTEREAGPRPPIRKSEKVVVSRHSKPKKVSV